MHILHVSSYPPVQQMSFVGLGKKLPVFSRPVEAVNMEHPWHQEPFPLYVEGSAVLVLSGSIIK